MISFTVEGHPVPYQRMTRAQIHNRRAGNWRSIQRYFAYKDSVRAAALGLQFDRAPKIKTFVHICIYFKNRAHGDPDNVFKAILDSVFENDKNCCGSMNFFYDPERPRVEVKIEEET